MLELAPATLTEALYNKVISLPRVPQSGMHTIVSQPSKCLKFMTFQKGCFVIHVEYKYLREALETFYHNQFYKR